MERNHFIEEYITFVKIVIMYYMIKEMIRSVYNPDLPVGIYAFFSKIVLGLAYGLGFGVLSGAIWPVSVPLLCAVRGLWYTH